MRNETRICMDDEKGNASSRCLEGVIAVFSNNIDIADTCVKTLETWEEVTLAMADNLERLLTCRPPAKFLDLACGRGDIAIALAQRGYDVTAIDCTPAMLSVAVELSQVKHNHVKWICADMRTINFDREMDYIMLRDVIFSIFPSGDEDNELLHRMARALKPGGRCLFEVYNKEFGVRHKVENRFEFDAKRNVFVAPGDTALPTVRLYTDEEWNQMLEHHGLTIVSRDGWRWKDDPCPPPWRADFIIAEKRADA